MAKKPRTSKPEASSRRAAAKVGRKTAKAKDGSVHSASTPPDVSADPTVEAKRRSARSRTRMEKAGQGPTGKVGPGNPPEATRFKPGQSGNPNGRPRKERSLLKHLETELDTEIQITEGGSTVRLTKRQALAKSLVHNALKGDHKALMALLRLLPPERHQDTEEFANVPLETVLRFLTRKGHADDGDEE